MHKRISTTEFNNDDVFVDSIIPESYEVNDYDQSLEHPENAYWGDFSTLGQNLRRRVSYFVAGNSENSYFKKQMELNDELNESNESIEDINKQQTIRFNFVGNEENMSDEFKNVPYAVHIDGEGTYRVFMIINNSLSIKKSNGANNWKYDVKEVDIHKEYVDPNVNKGKVIKIHNIQVVRNDYDSNALSILYFSDNMLFIRHLSSYLLNSDEDKMKEYLELNSSSANKPIFLVGNMPEQMRNKKVEEINNSISREDSELLINIPYNTQEVEKFNENFNVDMETQVFGYTTPQGLIRVLYKDNFGLLNSIVIDSLIKPTPEVWYVNQENN